MELSGKMGWLPATRFFLFSILSSCFSLSIGGDTLTPAIPLTDGQELISAGEVFVLGFFSPIKTSNRYVGIWYKVSPPTVVWVANRRHPISDRNGSLSITANGTLIITDQNSKTIWSSGSLGLASPVAQLLDNGKFIVKEANVPGSFAWQSFDFPTDTLLPEMKLGWDLTSGLNRNLTSWTNPSDPAPGPYTLAVDLHGDPQIILWEGSNQRMRVGSWNGKFLSGVPDILRYKIFKFEFVIKRDEVFYMCNTTSTSYKTRFTMNYTGFAERYVWLDDSQTWSTYFSEPKDRCDYVSQCGDYGICNTEDYPICSCLQGFKPRSPTNWDLRDGRDGCERMTKLDCQNGTDGFAIIEGKLPDTSRSTVDRSMGLDRCRATCLRNCSCTAYASVYINGTGCIIWTTELTDIRLLPLGGQDLYVRLAAADLGKGSDHSNLRTIAGIVVGLVTGILLLSSGGICLWIKRRRRTVFSGAIPSASHRNECKEGKDWEIPLFDLRTIIEATNNFSIENKLGQGGFGSVYKGKLVEQEIAVKRLSKTSTQGTDEFMNEVMLIAKLQHRNLVRILGCCTQGEECMLVYEYMPNKSLDAFIFDKDKYMLLDWQTCYNIIEGIAQGLLYLHRDSRLRIIHRDLKASNILLDKDMNPKISDFGVARIFKGDETTVNTQRVVGTYGYMSPEYIMYGLFSVKSDVFSFGVLVLEIISGKKNSGDFVSRHERNLLAHAWSLWTEGNGLELVDESLRNSISMVEALNCLKIGLLCVQECPDDRPTMSSVVLMLGSKNASLPDPKHPGFLPTRTPFELESSRCKKDSASINELSITVVDGR